MILADIRGEWSDGVVLTTPRGPLGDCRMLKLLDRRITYLLRQDLFWHAFFAKNGISPIFVSYESLLEDRIGTLKKICAFLGVEETAISMANTREPERPIKNNSDEYETIKKKYLSNRKDILPTWRNRELQSTIWFRRFRRRVSSFLRKVTGRNIDIDKIFN
jgi:hypothetical protein